MNISRIKESRLALRVSIMNLKSFSPLNYSVSLCDSTRELFVSFDPSKIHLFRASISARARVCVFLPLLLSAKFLPVQILDRLLDRFSKLFSTRVLVRERPLSKQRENEEERGRETRRMPRCKCSATDEPRGSSRSSSARKVRQQACLFIPPADVKGRTYTLHAPFPPCRSLASPYFVPRISLRVLLRSL